MAATSPSTFRNSKNNLPNRIWAEPCGSALFWCPRGQTAIGVAVKLEFNWSSPAVNIAKIGDFCSPPLGYPAPMATSTPKPIPRGKWATYDNTTYKYRLDVPPRWTVRDSEKSSVEILSPDPEFASLNIYYMGTTVLSQEGYANQIIRERENASDGSYKLLRRSSGGFNKYKIARLDFEVRHGSGFCDALVTDLVVILKVEKDLFHLISVRNCRQGIDQYEAPLKRILDSFFLYR